MSSAYYLRVLCSLMFVSLLNLMVFYYLRISSEISYLEFIIVFSSRKFISRVKMVEV